MWQSLEKLLGQAQHHCEICVCLCGLTVSFVKRFTFVFEAIATHEGQNVAEGKAVPCSWTSRQESGSYSPVAPLHCGWAPARGQLQSLCLASAPGQKTFLLAGMATEHC